ncbi:MAG: hypothetical protein NC041_09520 [Bacteroides sp.]|nr:hypothetical protein [Prevotella sp.]MCM1408774.1 hypothetical protein [Treponema brennaborense]MCM1470689.1 hypothetical protein [Bacteroides sp.]
MSFLPHSMKIHIQRIAGTLLIACSAALHAVPHFSGLTGGGLAVIPKSEEDTADFSVTAFFSGQFDFTKNLIFRTQMNIKTENIFGSNLFEDTPSLFKLEEASLTYQGTAGTISHYITAFLGCIDPIGSDIFLRRMFGVPAFASKLTEPVRNLYAAGIYPLSGAGLAYTMKMPANVTAGAYIYYNKNTQTEQDSAASANPTNPLSDDAAADGTEESDADRSLNFDLRFGGAWNYFLVDAAAGFSMALEKKDSAGEDVILIIKEADFHAGASFFFGSRHTVSMLLQAGITKLHINPSEESDEEIISLKNVYFLIEPRFASNNLCFSMTLFNIPDECMKDLSYISNSLGVDVSLYSNNLTIGSRNAQIGTHAILSLPGIDDFTDFSVRIAPFMWIILGSGKLDACIKSDILEYTSFDNFLKHTELSISYKVQI